jgi:3-deoxy-D-manno-octulosonic-acid transferase
VKKVISKIQPLMFITLETEIWPNFLRELKRRGIPSMMVSGRISRNSFRSYYFFRVFFKKVLSMISFFCMQTEMDRKRILDIGADPKKTVVTGSIKFDQQVPAITVEENEGIYQDLDIRPGQNIFIAGSTHKGEEELIVSVFQELKNKVPDLIMILAPRHPERFDDVALLLKQTGVDFIRKTELASMSGHYTQSVILLDTIGELAKIYSVGTIIYIGGSLVPVGGHNVLEPAVFSKPVLFGNYMGNFAEIASILIEKDAAIQVSNTDEFAEQALALLNNPALGRQIGESAFAVIRENSGAVKRSVEILKQFMDG